MRPLLLLLVAVALFGAEFRGKVVGIADGDTITVLEKPQVSSNAYRIRPA